MNRLKRVALATLALAGCGDALVGEAYRGPVVARIEGIYAQPHMNVEDRDRLRLAVFWAPGGEFETDGDALIEHRASTTGVGDGFRFVLTVHDEPESEHLTETPEGGVYGVGLLVVYDDLNRNNRRDADEPIVGGAGNHALLWVPEALSADRAPRGRAIPAGMHVVKTPTECGSPPNLPSRTTCEVPFHAPCRTDCQCWPEALRPRNCGGPGAGPGMMKQGMPNTDDIDGSCDDSGPGGQCVLLQRQNRRNCVPRPEQAVFAPQLSTDMTSLGTYIKACQVDADCRTGEGYRCDQWLGGCVNTEQPGLLVDPDAPQRAMPTFCPPGQTPDGNPGMMPDPMNDGGMMPPEMMRPDGGMMPPDGMQRPDGGMGMRRPDGGMRRPDGGMGMRRPDGGRLPP